MTSMPRFGSSDLATAAGVVLTAGASLFLLTASPVSGTLVSAGAAGERVAGVPATSLPARHEMAVLVSLASPVVFALIPWWTRRSRYRRRMTVASSVALTVFVVVTSWSVGVAYIPGALAFWVDVIARANSPGTTSRSSGEVVRGATE